MEEVLEEKNVPTKSKKDAFMEYARSKYEGFDPEDEEGMFGTLMETMTSADKSNNYSSKNHDVYRYIYITKVSNT